MNSSHNVNLPPAATEGQAHLPYQPEWAPWVRQVVAIGLVISGVYALTLLAPVASILITTFLISFLIFIPARLLAKVTPLNYPVSVLIIFLIVLVAIIVLIVVIAPRVADLVVSLQVGADDLIRRVTTSLTTWEPSAGPYLIDIFNFQVDLTQVAAPIREALLAEQTDDLISAIDKAQRAILGAIPPIDVQQIIGTLTQIVSGLVGTVSQFISTLFLGLFLSLLILLELPKYQRDVLLSGPSEVQRENRLLVRKVFNVWQGFFNGQLLLCGIIGLVTFAQLRVMGIAGAVPLAFGVALLSLIPTLGGILSLIPLFIVPLLQGSTATFMTGFSTVTVAVLVTVVNLVITQIIWNFIAPKIMGDALTLPLPAIIIGIIIGTAIGGALGAFLIAPVLGTLRIVVLYLVAKVRRVDPFPGDMVPEVVDLNVI
jgi:predicted PurR-regulated permease PerM